MCSGGDGVINLQFKGDRVVVSVDIRGGRVAKIEKSIDDFNVDMKAVVRNSFREKYNYSVEWFARSVSKYVEERMIREVHVIAAEAVVNCDQYPATYCISRFFMPDVKEFLSRIAKKVIPLDSEIGKELYMLDKCFVIAFSSRLYTLPYDPSKICIGEEDKPGASRFIDIEYVNIHYRYKLPMEVRSVMDYYLLLCSSVG
jgi:hypothetical protein